MAKEIITGSEIRQMIKEEYERKLTEIALKKKLKSVNEQIKRLEECENTSESNIEEVEAGGEMKVRSTAWTGEKGGDTKFEPKFDEKKAGGRVAALKEDEDETFEVDLDASEEDKEFEISVSEEDIEKVLKGLATALDSPETVEAVKDAIQTTEEAPEEMSDEAPEETPEEAPEEIVAAAEVEEAPEEIEEDSKEEGENKVLNEELSRMAVLAGLKKKKLED